MEKPVLTRIRIADVVRSPFKQCHIMTRALGETVRQELETYLADSHGGLCLDFSGVTSIDFGCAQKIICKLLAKVGTNIQEDAQGKYIILENLAIGPKDVVQRVMNDQRLMILSRTPEGAMECIGIAHHKSWIPVFDRIVGNGYGDAKTIADQMGVKATKITPVLRRLSLARILWSKEPSRRGLQHLYELAGGLRGQHIRDLAIAPR